MSRPCTGAWRDGAIVQPIPPDATAPALEAVLVCLVEAPEPEEAGAHATRERQPLALPDCSGTAASADGHVGSFGPPAGRGAALHQDFLSSC